MNDVELIDALASVPPGRWTCPGDIAEHVGHPGAARAVAQAFARIFGRQTDISGFTLPVWRLRFADGSTMGAPSGHAITAEELANVNRQGDDVWRAEGGRIVGGKYPQDQRHRFRTT